MRDCDLLASGNQGIQVEMVEFRVRGDNWEVDLKIQCFHRGRGES